MTTETSNARGDSRPGIDRLWDSQWVNIVNSPEVLEAMGFRDCEEAVNIAVRMTEQAMAKNFAAARGDVRGLVAKWRAEADEIAANNWTCNSNSIRARADELEAALAAEGVQAGDVEQRARELLAAECGVSPTAFNDALPNATVSESIAIRAIVAALSQQPEARGVVDDMRREGWAVAVHNDYRLHGEQHTFWLFTKDGRAVKGEGRTDAEALSQVREQVAALTRERNG